MEDFVDVLKIVFFAICSNTMLLKLAVAYYLLQSIRCCVDSNACGTLTGVVVLRLHLQELLIFRFD